MISWRHFPFWAGIEDHGPDSVNWLKGEIEQLCALATEEPSCSSLYCPFGAGHNKPEWKIFLAGGYIAAYYEMICQGKNFCPASNDRQLKGRRECHSAKRGEP
jgi:hypothetical protein